MEQPFGHSLTLTLAPARTWLKLGPGWLAVAGLISTGAVRLDSSSLFLVAGLWLLADPLLGTLWELSGPQGVWRRISQAPLPPPPRRGFSLPYAQPGSPAGDFSLWIRRYQRWWRESYWPEAGKRVVTFGAGSGLALLLALMLGFPVFWLVLLALLFILLAGLKETDLAAAGGGRWETLVQFFIPGLMGAFLGDGSKEASLVLVLGYSVVGLGALRMIGGHARAGWLFFLGQLAVVCLLLSQRLLLGAAIAAICLIMQGLLRARYPQPAAWLSSGQVYLIISLLAAAFSLGF